MNAIPESPGPWVNVSKKFRRWLIDRGESLMARQLRAHEQYSYRPPALLLRLGITPKRQEYYWLLKKEFDAPRYKALKNAAERSRANAERVAAKGEPEAELKKRIFPKRYAPKGFAG